jgi:hypothetical protein
LKIKFCEGSPVSRASAFAAVAQCRGFDEQDIPLAAN